MVMVADLRAAETDKIFFRHVRASAVVAIGFLMADAAYFKLGVQVIP